MIVIDKKNLETLLQHSSVYVRGRSKVKPVKWVIDGDKLWFAISSHDRTMAIVGEYGKKYFEKIEGSEEWVFDAEKVIKAMDKVFKHTPTIKVYAENDKLVFEDNSDGRARLVIDQVAEEVAEIPRDMIDYIEGIPVAKKEGVRVYLYRADVVELGRMEPKERITVNVGEKVKIGGEIVKGSYAEVTLRTNPIRPAKETVVADYPPQVICPFAKKIKIGGVIGIHVDKDGEPGPLIIGEKQEDHVVVLWAVPLVQ